MYNVHILKLLQTQKFILYYQKIINKNTSVQLTLLLFVCLLVLVIISTLTFYHSTQKTSWQQY